MVFEAPVSKTHSKMKPSLLRQTVTASGADTYYYYYYYYYYYCYYYYYYYYYYYCLLYTSPSPRDRRLSRMPSSA